MSKKYVSVILPIGEAVWPHLNEVDVYKVTDKKGKPVIDKATGEQQIKRHFITGLRYNAADLKIAQDKIKAAALQVGADDDTPLTCFKKRKIKDSEGEVTGHEIILEAKAGEKHRPALFDAKKNSFPLSKRIGGGSKLKIKVTVNYFDGFGGGVNLYLDQAQVIELVEGGSSKDCAFDEEEGYVASADTDQTTETSDEPSESTDAYDL